METDTLITLVDNPPFELWKFLDSLRKLDKSKGHSVILSLPEYIFEFILGEIDKNFQDYKLVGEDVNNYKAWTSQLDKIEAFLANPGQADEKSLDLAKKYREQTANRIEETDTFIVKEFVLVWITHNPEFQTQLDFKGSIVKDLLYRGEIVHI